MHESLESVSNIPAFVGKLWKLVNDPETDELITWSANGKSFIITNAARFQQELLPLYFKHNNMASFNRQLNMYGFRKIVSIDGGGVKDERDVMQFAHTCFLKDLPSILVHIKRKSTSKIQIPSTEWSADIKGPEKQNSLLGNLLSDINMLKTKQAAWDSKLSTMKQENETLWRELAVLRQKHMKQEQIINKLIHFIVTMVQPAATRNVPFKRHYPLMINDSSRKETAAAALLRQQFINSKSGKSGSASRSKINVTGNAKRAGPTIRELDPLEEIIVETFPPDDPIYDNDVDYEDDNVGNDVQDNEVDYPVEVLSPESISSCSGKNLLQDLNPMTPVNPLLVAPAGSTYEAFEPPQAKRPRKDLSKKDVAKSANNHQKVKVIRKCKASRKNPTPLRSFDQTSSDKEDTQPFSLPEMSPGKMFKINGGNKISMGSDKLELVEDPSFFQELPVTIESEVLPNTEEEKAQLETDNITLSDNEYGNNTTTIAVVQPPLKETENLLNHVDSVQTDLEVLKEFLKGENLSLDANMLLELFNDDPISLSMPPAAESTSNQPEAASNSNGNELMQYNGPNLMDLVDLYSGSSETLDEEKRSSSPTLQLPDLNTPASTPKAVPSASPYLSKVKRKAN